MAVENCPMFSLRSNSIAVRYRSQLGAVFFQMRSMKHVQQKQLCIRFAHTSLKAKASIHRS